MGGYIYEYKHAKGEWGSLTASVAHDGRHTSKRLEFASSVFLLVPSK